MLSRQAQLYLEAQPAASAFPAADDLEGWARYVAETNDQSLRRTREAVQALGLTFERAGRLVRSDPPTVRGPGRLVSFHGGGFVFMGGEVVGPTAALEAGSLCRQVLAIDYRQPPDHPFPAALDDCLDAYRELLGMHDPRSLAFYGRSAGGNLAVATCIAARDAGLPLPRCVILESPQIDLTESGDSFEGNRGRDMLLTGDEPYSALYAGAHDLRDPRLSPLFADFSKGFPPALIYSGTRDLFLSNAVRLHRILRRYGSHFDLHIWEGAPHGGFPGCPEQEEVSREIDRFLRRFGL